MYLERKRLSATRRGHSLKRLLPGWNGLLSITILLGISSCREKPSAPGEDSSAEHGKKRQAASPENQAADRNRPQAIPATESKPAASAEVSDGQTETRLWRSDIDEIADKDEMWNKARFLLNVSEDWITHKVPMRETIEDMKKASPESARTIGVIGRYEVARYFRDHSAEALAKDYPSLVSLDPAQAGDFLSSWGKAAGLPPEFQQAMLYQIWNRGSLPVAPTDAEYEAALQAQPSFVEQYYQSAMPNVTQVSAQEGFIHQQGSDAMKADRQSYSGWIFRQLDPVPKRDH